MCYICELISTQGPPRTSDLSSPIMLLTGHPGEIYCTKFHPSGNTLASAGFDRQICKFLSFCTVIIFFVWSPARFGELCNLWDSWYWCSLFYFFSPESFVEHVRRMWQLFGIKWPQRRNPRSPIFSRWRFHIHHEYRQIHHRLGFADRSARQEAKGSFINCQLLSSITTRAAITLQRERWL